MYHFVQVVEIIALQEQSIRDWELANRHPLYTKKDFFALIEKNHAFNFQLWHAEDRARRDDQGFEFVYHAKRVIDHFNQQRNNFVEAIDAHLVSVLHPSLLDECPVHSETPGMMIDRLSILAMKIYYMEQQTTRDRVDEKHREACSKKLQILKAQQYQLGQCLQQFLQEIESQTRTFKVYHQFKMYNDPSLNPELYGAKEKRVINPRF